MYIKIKSSIGIGYSFKAEVPVSLLSRLRESIFTTCDTVLAKAKLPTHLVYPVFKGFVTSQTHYFFSLDLMPYSGYIRS